MSWRDFEGKVIKGLNATLIHDAFAVKLCVRSYSEVHMKLAVKVCLGIAIKRHTVFAVKLCMVVSCQSTHGNGC